MVHTNERVGHPISRQPVQQECFLCAYIQQLQGNQRHVECAEPCISGRFRSVSGNSTLVISLDEDDHERAAITLDEGYYRRLISSLRASGRSVWNLPVTVYHLPAYGGQSEIKGKIYHKYAGDSYTLVVLDADMLLNITDLSQADYCQRKYFLNHLVTSPQNSQTLLGTIVHTCFTTLLKEGQTDNDGRIDGEIRDKTPLELLQQTCEKTFDLKKLEIAQVGISTDELRIQVRPHLERLASWYEMNSNTLWGQANSVRAETTLLVPEIGMRGRLDLLWQQASGQALLELKTGGASGEVPKGDHRKQVNGYQMLLLVRNHIRLNRTGTKIVYSGTPGQASECKIDFNIRSMQRLNEIRNMLVLSRVTGIAPSPPGVRQCAKCSMQSSCMRVSTLLDWQPPVLEPDEHADSSSRALLSRLYTQQYVDEQNSVFFKHYYDLLQLEGQAGEEELQRLWKAPIEQRVHDGKAIDGLHALGDAVPHKDGWTQTFSCENTSELREGDEILLSGEHGPCSENVVTGTILSIGETLVTVWMRERIENAVMLDAYESDIVHIRNQKNLLRWLDADFHLQDLVASRISPRFSDVAVPVNPRLNTQQQEAVSRALQMQDYLLIQGPPGTGKTKVIAEIVRRLVERGERVLLAAFTNQAVDNMLQRLTSEGMKDFLRLGHERSVDASVHPQLFSNIFRQEHEQNATTLEQVLRRSPIVASTTATWSSEEYVQPDSFVEKSDSPFAFDVAIIDEASQLTVPALLGALRFVKRFILVGDEKQLPPLVMSEQAAKKGLRSSLFEQLAQQHPEACTALTVQYRMNKRISDFPSTMFYHGRLEADRSVANRQLPDLDWQQQRLIQLQQESEVVTRTLHPASPIVFLDTQTYHETPRETYTSEPSESEHGKSSKVEAHIVCSLVEGLLRRALPLDDIGIIAPYRAQVALIRRLLSQRLQTDIPPTLVNTVDRFQGGEREVIILSFATIIRPREHERRFEFLTDPHRLNVALTRAKAKLILVGNAPALQELPVFRELLGYCERV